MTHYVLTMSTRQAGVLLRRIDRNKENPMNDATYEAAIAVREAILRAAEHISHKLQQLTETVEELRRNLIHATPPRREGCDD